MAKPKKDKPVKKSPKPSKARVTEQPAGTPTAPDAPAEGRRKETPKRTGRRGIGPREAEAVSMPNSSEGSSSGTESNGEPLFPETPTKGPRQSRLPQMEDAEIEELEDAALTYAEVRDARQALTPREVEAKERLLALMKANDKQTYRHGGIEITRIVEKEKIKVRVKKEKEGGDE